MKGIVKGNEIREERKWDRTATQEEVNEFEGESLKI